MKSGDWSLKSDSNPMLYSRTCFMSQLVGKRLLAGGEVSMLLWSVSKGGKDARCWGLDCGKLVDRRKVVMFFKWLGFRIVRYAVLWLLDDPMAMKCISLEIVLAWMVPSSLLMMIVVIMSQRVLCRCVWEQG